MRRRLLTIAALWVELLGTASAVERFVPQGGPLNYPTIQAAITASRSGDIVRVQPGVYQESIAFRSADLTLTSLDPADPNVVRSTVLQGDGSHSVVSFTGGQSTNAVLTGFTIQGGGGTGYASLPFQFQEGGGIYCSQSSPSIIGNVIEENRLGTNSTTTLVSGGGIAIEGGSPRIARNVLRNNSAFTGGAIYSVGGNPLVEDNWIYSNSAVIGGGAFLQDSGQFINNTVVANANDNLNVEGTMLVMNNIIATACGPGMAIGPLAMGLSQWCHFNDFWNNLGGDVIEFLATDDRAVGIAPSIPVALEGIDDNFSEDPRFVDSSHFDFHLSSDSPCVNAGDPGGWRSSNEVDIDGASRVVALRVDLGAAELHSTGDEPPSAHAGQNRTLSWNSGQVVTLDGTGSYDPNGLPLRFIWRQVAGPPVPLSVSNGLASFRPTTVCAYRFELVVNNGFHDSRPDVVQILMTDLPLIASAGLGRSLATVPDSLVLDGSHCLDPEGQPLMYHWRQVAGPIGQWNNAQSVHPVFKPAGPGVYGFELVASDAFQSSVPDRVTYYLGKVPPVANAGLTRYAGRGAITLDGSRSFAPNNSAPLEFAWRQLSGPPLNLDKTNTAYPVIQGFQQLTNKLRQAVFELVVRAGDSATATDTVAVVIVPTWKNSTLTLSNPPFNPLKPTIVGFSGGNCDSGSPVSFPTTWRALANLFTTSYNRDPDSSLSAPEYLGYGDQLITILSELAPEYEQPIQTLGWSTGNMPAADVAERLNTVYMDPRYLVNRISFLDTGCNNARYATNISDLTRARSAGKAFWIDNYYSVGGQFRQGALNIQFPVPPAVHATPNDWYFQSWNAGLASGALNLNEGVLGGAFFSVIGPGKNYQVEAGQSPYYFGWKATRSTDFPLSQLVPLSPITGRLPGLVELDGPSDGAVVKPGSVLLSSQPVLNAVKYEVLIGPSSHGLDWVAWVGDAPPHELLSELPFPTTWWTVRATDSCGTTSQADPRALFRDTDGDGLSDEMEVFVYHTDPDNPDTDADGRPDGQEILTGADPLSPFDEFTFGCQFISSDQLRLSWFADPGRIYDIEFSGTLSPSSWQTVETVTVPALGGFTQHTISRQKTSLGFYRLHARTE
jgi:hypothetical protein